MNPSESHLTDVQLLAGLAERRESALDTLMKRYWESLYRKAWTFLRDEDQAKDCVQEVFIALWENREVSLIENLSAYLHQAARFRAMAAIRKNKRLEDLARRSGLLTSLVVHDDPPDLLLFKELKEKLGSILDSFPEQQRQIFRMNREAGMTYQQIADTLGISVKTVEKKMSLSLKAMRIHFKDSLLLVLCLSFL